MPVPAPPPAPGPPRPEAGLPDAPPDALDEVRARLAALDDRPLQDHPEQFEAIDRLLRSALDGSDRAGSR